MFLSSSFLNLTVWTPESALTTVDLPCATCPMVPMLMVACLEITSGERGVSLLVSRLARSCLARCACPLVAVSAFPPSCSSTVIARPTSEMPRCMSSDNSDPRIG